ncbi:hypothetical protein JCM11251_002585 [Rhodosporidiobolus azoricus]
MAAAESEDDDYVPRRTATPLARLDSQRADFPSSPSASSTPFGSPANPSPPLHNNGGPRAGRPAPKSAGSASLPAKPHPMGIRREGSWEEDLAGGGGGAGAGRGRGAGRRASLRRIEMTPATEGERGEGPFEDPLRSDWGASRSDLSSLPSRSPELDFRRRGSAVSTSSALSSYSPHHTSFLVRPPNGSSLHTSSRHSISSFGGHTLNTIGDMSNSSMPLLVKQPTRESQYTTSYSPASSRDGRPRAATTLSNGSGAAANGRPISSYSFSQQSDASSVHSYPPKPRERTRSATGSSGEDGGHGGSYWARELERTSATGQIKREKSREAKPDPWPAFVNASYIHQPVARPPAAYQSSLSAYSFPGPSTRTPPIPVNPLAPLRKRLARSLAMTNSHGRRLHTEVQLLLELIDALEHCITSFAPHRQLGDSNASSSAARPSTASSSRSALVEDPLSALTASTRLSSTSISSTPNGTSTPTASTSSSALSTSTSAASIPTTSGPAPVPRSGQSKSSLVDEVRLLVRELVELVPDACRCLAEGQYGPLARSAGSGSSTKALLASLEDERGGRETSAWWPRRLARDCRALLEEAGLQVGTGATAASSVSWLLAAQWAAEGGEEGAGAEEGGAVPPHPSAGLTGAGRGVVFRREGDLTLSSEDGANGGRSEARKEQLLMQGKERWEAYKAKVEALKQYEG